MGGLSPLNPPGLCETNLGSVAAASEGTTLGVNGGVGIVASNLIGEGTEPTIYELFDSGSPTMIDPGGGITFSVPDFDLRDPGNDPLLTTPLTQRDLNQGNSGLLWRELCATAEPYHPGQSYLVHSFQLLPPQA